MIVLNVWKQESNSREKIENSPTSKEHKVNKGSYSSMRYWKKKKINLADLETTKIYGWVQKSSGTDVLEWLYDYHNYRKISMLHWFK